MKITTRFFAGTGLAVATLLAMSAPAFAADMLNRSLSQGMSGTDVSSLQQFLARDVAVYPQGIVSGYYGALTTAAVSKFQAKNGIAVVGRVGPVTLAAINAQMGGGTSVGGETAIISGASTNVSRNGANVMWSTDQNSKGVVFYSTSPLTTFESQNAVTVSGQVALTDLLYHTSQNVSITGLNANTVYYYMIYTTDQAGYVTVTVPSTFQTTN